MKLFKKLLPAMLALPLASFAAFAPINDWAIEPNGDVRVEIGEETVFVSTANESEYLQTLIAARLHWPVEVVNGHIVVNTSAVPATEIGALASCSGPTCSFTGVSRPVYKCLLSEMEALIKNPPPPATAPGTITSWPNGDENYGVATFTMPPFIGPFSISVTFNEPELLGQILAKPTKPVLIPDAVIWGYVETELNGCKAANP